LNYKIQVNKSDSDIAIKYNQNLDIGELLYNESGLNLLKYCGKNDEYILLLDKNHNLYRSANNGRTFSSMNELLEKKAINGLNYGGEVSIEDIICIGTKE
jgi:hypothetical protein